MMFYTRRIITAWVIISLLFAMNVGINARFSASAQGVDNLIVLPPDCADFPILSTQIKPKLVPGMEAIDLQRADLNVVENDREVQILDVEKQRAGVHFSLVINGDRLLDVRDAKGESPYDRIGMALKTWVDTRRFSPEDTLSLVTQEGDRIRNTSDREAWLQALADYQPNFRAMVPDLASLETALRLSEERVVPFGVDKVLLYITPPPTIEEILPLLTLAETARAAEIQVHVWMLGEDFFLNNDQGGALINLAAVTGGQFFHYTGAESLPNPEAYLEGLGVYYQLRFESGIRQEGTYTITVEAMEGELCGESSDFYLNVQPPNPILLDPPANITRSAPPDWEGDGQQLDPTSLPIEFMLEFPDDYPRDLIFSRLYVDGRLVDERTQVPFESLTWDLTAIVEPGTHQLQVKVEDSLGLAGETILTPIQVELILPEPEPPVSMQGIGLIIVGVLLAAALLLLIFWSLRHFLKSAFAQRMAKKVFEFRKQPAEINAAQGEHDGEPFASLLPLADASVDLAHSAIQIKRKHTAFGSDPERADLVLEGEDIDGLHARLRAMESSFWLSDSGSSGGTWVNYQRIGTQPVQLFPGDLIHFGSAGFRFTIIDVESPPKASVEKYDLIL